MATETKVTLTSASNSKIKFIRKLRDRKNRENSGLFYIEGLRIVAEAIQQNARVEYLVTSSELLTSDFGARLLQSAVDRNITIMEVSADTFRSFALKEGPQGIAAVIHQAWQEIEQVVLEPGKNWVALDAVQDPGNLGTITRTLDAVGGGGLFLLTNSTDPYDPTSVRASMGSIFSLKLVKVNIDQFTHWKKNHGYALIGTSGTATLDYHYFDYPDPSILLMGSEREGLNEQYRRLCDNIIKIPMVGRSDSLNLAVATAVILYEIFDQRRDRS